MTLMPYDSLDLLQKKIIGDSFLGLILLILDHDQWILENMAEA